MMRQAYRPRFWPVGLATLAIFFVVSTVVGALGVESVLVHSGLGLVIGVGVGQVRSVVWRRRHPIRDPVEVVELVRRMAPWN